MNKIGILSLSGVLLVSSCGTYQGDGITAGAMLGSVIGSAIGGITGGPRGSDIGTLVGMAGGAVIGGTIEAQAEKEAEERQRESDYRFERKYREHRDLAYYASRLCITPHYLSEVCRYTCGRPATYWIDRFTMQEITRLLACKELPLARIAERKFAMLS